MGNVVKIEGTITADDGSEVGFSIFDVGEVSWNQHGDNLDAHSQSALIEDLTAAAKLHFSPDA